MTESGQFLRGLMAPVLDERDDVDLDVTGQLPAALRGMFVRNGPNPQFAPKVAYHPFDGDGMLHSIVLDNGAARYRNRWIQSRGLLAERQRGQALYGGLAEFTLPPADVIEESGITKNVANTHVIRHAGRMMALFEASPPTLFSHDLETLGEWNFEGKLQGPCTAHPKIDPATGEMMFFGYSPFPPYLRYYVADAAGVVVHSTPIDLPRPVMIHDFVATEHWTVFFDSPAVFHPESLEHGGPLIRWQPECGTRIGVLPRRGDGSQIRWFDVDSQYVVHTFNAWDEGGRIEIFAPRMSFMPSAFGAAVQEDSAVPLPWRWSIDLETGTVHETQLDDRPGDFPRINDAHATTRTRYLYNCPANSWDLAFDFVGVVKYDLDTGTSSAQTYAASEVSGEHVFVSDPDRPDEDGGWLLTLVTDRVTERTDLVILDAQNVAADPVARVHLPRRVPIGFHANWFPDVS